MSICSPSSHRNGTHSSYVLFDYQSKAINVPTNVIDNDVDSVKPDDINVPCCVHDTKLQEDRITDALSTVIRIIEDLQSIIDNVTSLTEESEAEVFELTNLLIELFQVSGSDIARSVSCCIVPLSAVNGETKSVIAAKGHVGGNDHQSENEKSCKSSHTNDNSASIPMWVNPVYDIPSISIATVKLSAQTLGSFLFLSNNTNGETYSQSSFGGNSPLILLARYINIRITAKLRNQILHVIDVIVKICASVDFAMYIVSNIKNVVDLLGKHDPVYNELMEDKRDYLEIRESDMTCYYDAADIESNITPILSRAYRCPYLHETRSKLIRTDISLSAGNSVQSIINGSRIASGMLQSFTYQNNVKYIDYNQVDVLVSPFGSRSRYKLLDNDQSRYQGNSSSGVTCLLKQLLLTCCDSTGRMSDRSRLVASCTIVTVMQYWPFLVERALIPLLRESMDEEFNVLDNDMKNYTSCNFPLSSIQSTYMHTLLKHALETEGRTKGRLRVNLCCIMRFVSIVEPGVLMMPRGSWGVYNNTAQETSPFLHHRNHKMPSSSNELPIDLINLLFVFLDPIRKHNIPLFAHLQYVRLATLGNVAINHADLTSCLATQTSGKWLFSHINHLHCYVLLLEILSEMLVVDVNPFTCSPAREVQHFTQSPKRKVYERENGCSPLQFQQPRQRSLSPHHSRSNCSAMNSLYWTEVATNSEMSRIFTDIVDICLQISGTPFVFSSHIGETSRAGKQTSTKPNVPILVKDIYPSIPPPMFSHTQTKNKPTYNHQTSYVNSSAATAIILSAVSELPIPSYLTQVLVMGGMTYLSGCTGMVMLNGFSSVDVKMCPSNSKYVNKKSDSVTKKVQFIDSYLDAPTALVDIYELGGMRGRANVNDSTHTSDGDQRPFFHLNVNLSSTPWLSDEPIFQATLRVAKAALLLEGRCQGLLVTSAGGGDGRTTFALEVDYCQNEGNSENTTCGSLNRPFRLPGKLLMYQLLSGVKMLGRGNSTTEIGSANGCRVDTSGRAWDSIIARASDINYFPVCLYNETTSQILTAAAKSVSLIDHYHHPQHQILPVDISTLELQNKLLSSFSATHRGLERLRLVLFAVTHSFTRPSIKLLEHAVQRGFPAISQALIDAQKRLKGRTMVSNVLKDNNRRFSYNGRIDEDINTSKLSSSNFIDVNEGVPNQSKYNPAKRIIPDINQVKTVASNVGDRLTESLLVEGTFLLSIMCAKSPYFRSYLRSVVKGFEPWSHNLHNIFCSILEHPKVQESMIQRLVLVDVFQCIINDETQVNQVSNFNEERIAAAMLEEQDRRQMVWEFESRGHRYPYESRNITQNKKYNHFDNNTTLSSVYSLTTLANIDRLSCFPLNMEAIQRYLEPQNSSSEGSTSVTSQLSFRLTLQLLLQASESALIGRKSVEDECHRSPTVGDEERIEAHDSDNNPFTLDRNGGGQSGDYLITRPDTSITPSPGAPSITSPNYTSPALRARRSASTSRPRGRTPTKTHSGTDDTLTKSILPKHAKDPFMPTSTAKHRSLTPGLNNMKPYGGSRSSRERDEHSFNIAQNTSSYNDDITVQELISRCASSSPVNPTEELSIAIMMHLAIKFGIHYHRAKKSTVRLIRGPNGGYLQPIHRNNTQSWSPVDVFVRELYVLFLPFNLLSVNRIEGEIKILQRCFSDVQKMLVTTPSSQRTRRWFLNDMKQYILPETEALLMDLSRIIEKYSAEDVVFSLRQIRNADCVQTKNQEITDADAEAIPQEVMRFSSGDFKDVIHSGNILHVIKKLKEFYNDKEEGPDVSE